MTSRPLFSSIASLQSKKDSLRVVVSRRAMDLLMDYLAA